MNTDYNERSCTDCKFSIGAIILLLGISIVGFSDSSKSLTIGVPMIIGGFILCWCSQKWISFRNQPNASRTFNPNIV